LINKVIKIAPKSANHPSAERPRSTLGIGFQASERHPIAQRKRRPFPGGVFVDLHDWNHLLTVVSILIP
jgi:hypothetical protein